MALNNVLSGVGNGSRPTAYLANASSSAERLRSLMGHRARYSSRQEEVLDALEDLFLTEGFRNVTIGDLVKRAHCSRATLYELAPTKEQLFLLVLDRLWRRVGAEARDATARAKDPAARIEAYLRAATVIFRPSPAFIDDIEAYGAARRLFDDHVAIAIDYLTALVEAGIESGQFRPVRARLAAEVLAAAASQFAGREPRDGTAKPAETNAHQATRLLLYGLVND